MQAQQAMSPFPTLTECITGKKRVHWDPGLPRVPGPKCPKRYWRANSAPPPTMETTEMGRIASRDVWDLVVAVDSIATGSNVGIEVEKLRESGAIYRVYKYVDEMRNRIQELESKCLGVPTEDELDDPDESGGSDATDATDAASAVSVGDK